jgi:hypothetical protein
VPEVANNRKVGPTYLGKENFNKSQASAEESNAANTFQRKRRSKQIDSRTSSLEVANFKQPLATPILMVKKTPDTPAFN